MHTQSQCAFIWTSCYVPLRAETSAEPRTASQTVFYIRGKDYIGKAEKIDGEAIAQKQACRNCAILLYCIGQGKTGTA